MAVMRMLLYSSKKEPLFLSPVGLSSVKPRPQSLKASQAYDLGLRVLGVGITKGSLNVDTGVFLVVC